MLLVFPGFSPTLILCWSVVMDFCRAPCCPAQMTSWGSASCSVAKPCPTLWQHGLHHARFSVLHYAEFSQTHVHGVGEATQPSHCLPSPSPPAFSLCQHRDLFSESVLPISGQSTGASASAAVLPINIQGWFPLGWTGLSVSWPSFDPSLPLPGTPASPGTNRGDRRSCTAYLAPRPRASWRSEPVWASGPISLRKCLASQILSGLERGTEALVSSLSSVPWHPWPGEGLIFTSLWHFALLTSSVETGFYVPTSVGPSLPRDWPYLVKQVPHTSFVTSLCSVILSLLSSWGLLHVAGSQFTSVCSPVKWI